YESSVQLMQEFTVLFNNARQYNEANSQIARDASMLLEMVIKAHANDKDAPYESPLQLKQKFGYYPDYYDEISRPMSLFMINKKLKRNGYQTFEELFKDFVQVFENACEYNMETSDIFIAARKLQNLTIRRARELQPSLDLSLYDKKSKIHLTPPPPAKVSKAPKTPKIDVETDSDEKEETEEHKAATELYELYKLTKEKVAKAFLFSSREKVHRAVDQLLQQVALPANAELSEDSEEDEDTEESDTELTRWNTQSLGGIRKTTHSRR
ncbi:Bromodomain protein, partial [Ancylostoma duodenale]